MECDELSGTRGKHSEKCTAMLSIGKTVKAKQYSINKSVWVDTGVTKTKMKTVFGETY